MSLSGKALTRPNIVLALKQLLARRTKQRVPQCPYRTVLRFIRPYGNVKIVRQRIFSRFDAFICRLNPLHRYQFKGRVRMHEIGVIVHAVSDSAAAPIK